MPHPALVGLMLLLWTFKKIKFLLCSLSSQLLNASALDVRHLCTVTHYTPPVTISLKTHTEKIKFHLYTAPHYLLIMGHP